MLESLRGRIIGVVGWKGSGKTTVVESLVRSLSAKGLVVGTVKHAHEEVLLDPGAKDSAKHLQAGARVAVAVGDGLVVLGQSTGEDLDAAAARYLSLCGAIVAEGFKHADIPKIVVLDGKDDILDEIENVVAVVCRDAGPGNYPRFAPDEIAGLADFLLESGSLKPSGAATTLFVNEKPVPLNEFVQTSLAGVVRGFITALRDVETASTIEIKVRLPAEDRI
jgi:molybdopterin-guanine dinucleotide biosynthesis protein B